MVRDLMALAKLDEIYATAAHEALVKEARGQRTKHARRTAEVVGVRRDPRDSVLSGPEGDPFLFAGLSVMG